MNEPVMHEIEAMTIHTAAIDDMSITMRIMTMPRRSRQ